MVNKFNKKSLNESKYFDKIKYFITDTDIKNVLPDSKIYLFSELDKFLTIYEMLPNKLDYCFILLESKTNTGHWTLMTRFNDKFEFFDSYGNHPKRLLDFIPKFMHKILDNDWDEDLGKLIKSIKKKDSFTYNKTKYQQELDNINTCGRHCILRVSLFLINSINNKQYRQILNKKQKELRRPYDEIVCM